MVRAGCWWLACLALCSVASAAGAGGAAAVPGSPLSSSRKKDRPDAAKVRQLEEAMLGSRPMSDNAFSAQVQPGQDQPNGVSLARVVISKAKAKKLSLKSGDVVTLRGKKRKFTLGEVSVSPTLKDDNVVQIVSSEVARNMRVRNNDVVVMNAVGSEVKSAGRITFQPFSEDLQQGELTAEELTENFAKKYFAENKFSHVDDVFSVTHESRVVQFKVTGLEAAAGAESEDKSKKGKKGNKTSGEEEEAPLSACIVTADTAFVCDLEDLPSRSQDPTLNEVGYDDIGGCRSQLAAIRELIELPLRHPTLFQKVGVPPPRGVLLHGPSGTGKTSLCRAVAAETGAFFFVVNGPEVMSKGSGESEKNLRLAFEEAEKNSPAIIFIDEIDCIAPKRDKAGGEMEKRTVSQLMTLMDGIKPTSQVVVIAATNRPNVMEPALRRFSRFDKEILISQPSEEGRLEILQIKTRDMKVSKSVNLADVARDTHGYVGADLSQVIMEAAFSAIREILPHVDIDADTVDPELLRRVEIRPEHFAHAVKSTNPSSLRENIVEVPDTTWEDIGGLVDVKRELQELVKLPIQFADLYAKFGTGSSKGVLMYGPPGCGKTLLAKAIANECGANFISIKGPELLDAHIGESEANIRALFAKARAASPCILFFDEMDSIAKARGRDSGGSGLGDNVINTILTEIDAIESTRSVFIIGATNRPDILDASITRPGHLDSLVYIPLPDFDSRVSIFKANLRKCPVAKDVDILKLARGTEGFSGADISEICSRAAKNAIREDIAIDVYKAKLEAAEQPSAHLEGVKEMTRAHFEEAMSRARRSVTDAQVEQYKQFIAKQRAAASDAVNFKFKPDGQGGAAAEEAGGGAGEGAAAEAEEGAAGAAS